MNKKLYIANDIECAGSMLGVHSALSWGACIVTAEEISRDEKIRRGLTFYVEFKPQSNYYELEAMRVGCVGLRCIENMLNDSRYDTTSQQFEPQLVLNALAESGETVQTGVERFMKWLNTLTDENTKIIPVINTAFFDSCFIKYLFGIAKIQSPYGWSGIDLDSLYKGYTKNIDNKLNELGIVDNRQIAHCALDDSILIADIARELIFCRIGNSK